MAILMPPKTKAQSKPSPADETLTAYQQAFEQRIAEDLAAGAPDWLGTLRQQAFTRFEALGMPNPRKDEAWKYVPVRTIASTPYALADAENTYLKRAEILPHLIAAAAESHIVLVDGVYSAELSTVKLPSDSGVVVSDLNSALKTHGKLLQKHLAKTAIKDPDPFVALNTALFGNGVFVYLPQNITLEKPVQILLVTTGGNEPKAVFNRVLIVGEKAARANILVQAVGLNAGQRLQHIACEVLADENAEIDITFFRRANAFMHQLANTQVVQQAGSKVAVATIALDGMPGPVVDRHSVTIDLLGEAAECVLNGLSVLSGTTEVYNHTVINHHVPNCQSSQIYKNILDDEAKGEFFGTIVVDKGADGTNSQQINRTLLLSNNAKIWTRPQLQISADDVKCAHGAAVGQLDDTQMFYLKSRGIDAELATCILTYGFAEEVVEKIADPAIRQYLDNLLLASLNHAQNPLSCDHVCNTCEIE